MKIVHNNSTKTRSGSMRYAAVLFLFAACVAYGQNTISETQTNGNGNKATETAKPHTRVIRDSGGSSIGQYDPSGNNTLPAEVGPYETLGNYNRGSRGPRTPRSSYQGRRDYGASSIGQPDPLGNTSTSPADRRRNEPATTYGNSNDSPPVIQSRTDSSFYDIKSNGNKGTAPADNQQKDTKNSQNGF